MTDRKVTSAAPPSPPDSGEVRRGRGRPKGSKNKKPAGIPIEAHAVVMAHREVRAARDAVKTEMTDGQKRITAWLDDELLQTVEARSERLGISMSQSFRDLIAIGANEERQMQVLGRIEYQLAALTASVTGVSNDAKAQAEESTQILKPSIKERLDSLPETLAQSIAVSFDPVITAITGMRGLMAGDTSDAQPTERREMIETNEGGKVPESTPIHYQLSHEEAAAQQRRLIDAAMPPAAGAIGNRFGRATKGPMDQRIKTELGK